MALGGDGLANSGDALESPGAVLVRATSRPADVVEFERSLVSFFVGAADMLGVPKSVAAIYGICFASAEPLAFSEIQERLDISAGSISQGLRILRDVGALKASDTVGLSTLNAQLSTRSARSRERYEPDLELRKLVSHFIEQRLDRQLHSGGDALNVISKHVPAGPEASKVLKARLKALQTWHAQARAVLPLVRTFLKLT